MVKGLLFSEPTREFVSRRLVLPREGRVHEWSNPRRYRFRLSSNPALRTLLGIFLRAFKSCIASAGVHSAPICSRTASVRVPRRARGVTKVPRTLSPLPPPLPSTRHDARPHARPSGRNHSCCSRDRRAHDLLLYVSSSSLVPPHGMAHATRARSSSPWRASQRPAARKRHRRRSLQLHARRGLDTIRRWRHCRVHGQAPKDAAAFSLRNDRGTDAIRLVIVIVTRTPHVTLHGLVPSQSFVRLILSLRDDRRVRAIVGCRRIHNVPQRVVHLARSTPNRRFNKLVESVTRRRRKALPRSSATTRGRGRGRQCAGCRKEARVALAAYGRQRRGCGGRSLRVLEAQGIERGEMGRGCRLRGLAKGRQLPLERSRSRA